MSRRLIAVVALACALVAVSAASALAVQTGSLSVSKVGNGYVGGGGIDCGATCSVTLDYGNCDTSTKPPVCEPQYVTLTAQDANGFVFNHWDGCEYDSGPVCGNPASSDAPNVTAYFDDVQDPTVRLTDPPAWSTLTGAITVGANASDNAAVARVQFYANGALLGQDDSAPYSVSLDTATLPDGLATIEAQAMDTSGRVSTRDAETVVVDNHDPVVQFTSGPNGGTYAYGTTQHWTFTTSDSGSGLYSVACAIDGDNFEACNGAGEETIANAAAGSHTLTVRAVDNIGRSTFVSRSWKIVTAPTATTLPSISGSPQVGQLLKASKGTWTGSPTRFAYKWLRCDATGTTCAPIGTADATDDLDYTPVAADTGHRLKITVTAFNVAGSKAATSAASLKVGLPVATVAPAINGATAKVGTMLTATSGTWAHGPVTLRYSWQRCLPGMPACITIGTADATDDADYTPVAADVGAYLNVKVTATNSVGSVSSTSQMVGAVTA